MRLPTGLSTRPLHLADAAAVTAVHAAQERADLGEVLVEEADIVGEWQRPSFDVPASTLGVFDADRLVAYAEFSGDDRGDAAVHPDYRGRGIGTELAHWMQDTARTQGAAVLGMAVAAGSPGERLLRALGYQARWTSWLLRLPGQAITPQPLPAGYAAREATPADYRAIWTVTEEAFAEWSTRQRQSFADFAAEVFDRPGFAAWNARVATGPDGQVVGVAQVSRDGDSAFVHRLAVDRAHRHRGLARALLVDAFAAGRAHGATAFDLTTDSRTGALALYEKVGMVVTLEWVNYAVTLTGE
ncbi:MAG TPA: GNAT family N-acetyltransferase [Jatrophihabitans sp.]|nr:GNAT family N-acetyltransferase [Jatrophihabitans sp.]